MQRLQLTLAAALACGATPAYAADTATDASASADQRDIVITGQRIEYVVKATSTATKTNTDIKNIPQALTVVSSGQIADQQLRSVS
jgi:catecholate siderophore receptor